MVQITGDLIRVAVRKLDGEKDFIDLNVTVRTTVAFTIATVVTSASVVVIVELRRLSAG